MAVSVFDLFSIGIGPSSSHTVGPMRAAGRFARHLADDGLLPSVARVRVELYGSLGATGAGHGTPGAVVLGLEGNEPEAVDPIVAKGRVEEINTGGKLQLAGSHTIQFDHSADIVLSLRAMDFHSNGMVYSAFDADGAEVSRRVYYSVGGGFVVDEHEAKSDPREDAAVPYPFNTAEELVRLATDNGCSIAELMALSPMCGPACCGSGRRCASASTRAWPRPARCPGSCMSNAARVCYRRRWIPTIRCTRWIG
jgi:L-serine dehydratase